MIHLPTYSYQCQSCEHMFERIYKIAERKLPEEQECPNCKTVNSVRQTLSPVPMGDPVRLGFTKPDNGFKEVLQKISEKTAGASGLKNTSQLTRL